MATNRNANPAGSSDPVPTTTSPHRRGHDSVSAAYPHSPDNLSSRDAQGVEGHLQHHLQQALNNTDLLWAHILHSDSHLNRGDEVAHHYNHLRDSHQHDSVGQSSSHLQSIRGHIIQAGRYATELFEANIECMAHVLALQKELYVIRTEKQAAEKEVNTKVNGLLYVIEGQQEKLQKICKVVKLKGLWRKLIVPHTREDDDSLSDNCAIAMPWLAARCTQEVCQNMSPVSTAATSGTLSTSGSPSQRNQCTPGTLFAGCDGLDSDAPQAVMSTIFLDVLLKKVGDVQSLMTEDVTGLERKIRTLSMQLAEKDKHIRALLLQKELSIGNHHDSETVTYVSVGCPVMHCCRDADVCRSLAGQLKNAELHVRELEGKLNLATADNHRLSNHYDASLAAREEWRKICNGRSLTVPPYLQRVSIGVGADAPFKEMLATRWNDSTNPDLDKDSCDIHEDLNPSNFVDEGLGTATNCRNPKAETWRRLSRPLTSRRKHQHDQRPPFTPPSPHLCVHRSTVTRSRSNSPTGFSWLSRSSADGSVAALPPPANSLKLGTSAVSPEIHGVSKLAGDETVEMYDTAKRLIAMDDLLSPDIP
jgi:hypothetical protein